MPIKTKNLAILITANIQPTGGPEVWSGNLMSTSFLSRNLALRMMRDARRIISPSSNLLSFYISESLFGSTESIALLKSRVAPPTADPTS